ncbi:flagellar biosynthesis protein FlhB [Pseudomonas sp. C27(2019)]|uniref:flagellar biosynthesis protein FlhB n=1 Tax=Pseudomonas sp. C27(2019) TaxID=2604941 RepID=UPI001248AC18|nr:flagellar biosynthesis protein FlhB [Pseudomonas sp. C27(2019)]QEY59039.1 flagellar biosynthesis protein FlhB [Pseudomonas sp. C27(2019)]
MAESESGAEKSEDPTEKRKQDSRKKGEIARSRELNTLAVVLAGTGGLLTFGGALGERVMQVMHKNFTLPRELLLDERSMVINLLQSALMAGDALIPLFFVLLVAAVVGPVALGGWLFSMEALVPKFSRMNPLSGLKRMVSMKSIVELLKALGKFSVVLTVALFVLARARNELIEIAAQPLEMAILHSMQVVGWSAFWLACSLIIIAAVDIPFQIWDSKQKLKMTKQEVRDEYKDSEGKPEVKGRIRQLQREMAERRMMSAVPEADVVITNPTHFAVALKYDAENGQAPILLAKGGDHTALKIREIANEHKIILLESPALARAVYYSTEIDQEIPAGLYLAVAQVLAYVYQLRQYHAGKAKKPSMIKEPEIPDDLRRDE